MDRDEFMELVYKTFADEPDNVLANGIIEAAEAYVEHEKAQLSEGTTKDAISRQAAIEKVRAMQTYKLFMGDDMILIDKAEVQTELMMLPSAQPERAKGEWSDGYRWQRCSLCKQTGKKSWNYCPNCGADMRGEKDERTD